MMNPDNPTNRMLQNVTLLVVLSPIYAAVLLAPDIGVVPVIRSLWAEGTPLASPLLYLVVLVHLAGMAWILLRGAFAGPISLVLGTMILYSMLAGGAMDHGKRHQLSIGAGRPMLGIDVYCNDVHLGKTPLTVTETEFNRLVKPWDTPPDQPRLNLHDHRDNDLYSSAGFTYAPNDVFDLWTQWPPDHERYNRHNDEETLRDFKVSKYWWRFEKNGCIGMTRLGNFGGGGGGGRLITIDINPNIEFPAASEHLDALLAGLEADDHVPSPEWVEHFLKYKDLLFLDFHGKARRNPDLTAVLDAIVRAEFDIPADPTEADCARVLDDILDRVEAARCFTVPSLESLAVERVGEAHSGPLVRRFLASQRLPGGGYSGRASSDNWTTYRRGGRAARLLPLEHAVRQTCPPELIDDLVYLSRNGRSLGMLGNYAREEVSAIVMHYFRQIERRGGRQSKSGFEAALRFCAQVRNPLLEEHVRHFVRKYAGHGHGGSRYAVRRFIASRVGDPRVDQGKLAEWIYHWAPLNDREKLEYMPRIQDPQAAHYVRVLLGSNDRRREDVIHKLGARPNPHFGEFVAESYDWYSGPRGPGYWSASMTLALAKTDSPLIREAIVKHWNEGDKPPWALINRLKSGDWRSPHMNWLVPMIAGLDNVNAQVHAAGLLCRIDSDDAYALAEKWSQDGNQRLAGAAREQLAIRDERTKAQRDRLATARALIAGEIQPDDLLPSAKAYTWKDGQYVPVPDASGHEGEGTFEASDRLTSSSTTEGRATRDEDGRSASGGRR